MIGVTGATGRVGGRVAHTLADAGIAQRLIVRDAARAPRLDAQIATTEYRNADPKALEGVTTLLMVSGAESADRVDEHRAFVAAAQAAGVQHLVYTSFDGAAPDATFTLGRDHWATEQIIRESGLRFTFLRDNFYSDFLPLMAGADGVIRGPAGEGRLAAVAIADVADCAAAVLQDAPAHRDATYRLTGPAALSLAEAADVITRITGRATTFHDETLDEAYASRASYGAPDWQVEAWVSTYTAIATGALASVSPDVERLTGHAARSLADVLATT